MRKALSSLPRASRSTLTSRNIAGARRCLATPAAQPPSPNDIFANGNNAYYAEEMYKKWSQDPSAVHASWDAYFRGLEKGLPSSQAFQPPPVFHADAAGGVPSFHISGSNDLTDHLKVSISEWFWRFLEDTFADAR